MSFSVDKKLSEPKKREAPWILNNDTKRARLDDSNSPNSFEENLKSSENSSVERRESDKECALSNQDIKKTPAQPNFVKIKRSSSKKPGGRFRKCGECSGCQKSECGVCQNCRISLQYKDKLKLGGAECLTRVCISPIPLTVDSIKTKDGKGKMVEMMALQDDGTSPFREINGELYDLRCYICKKLPRAGMANRSELYRHYSVYHFYKELIAEFSGVSSCPVSTCNKGALPKGKSLADHMGQVHNHVDKYLPDENKIPLKIQRSSHGRQSKGSSRKKTNIEFPSIPDNYDINTNEVAFFNSGVYVDGFEIYLQAEEEELEDTNTTPMDSSLFDHDLETAWKCGICNDMIIFKISALINHLQSGHKMTLTSLPQDDVVKFLSTEGFIKKVTDDELVEQECKDIDNEKKSYSELESVRQDIISEPMNEIEKPDVISSVQCDIDFITNEINSEKVEDVKEGFEGFNSGEISNKLGKENIGPVLL